MTIFRHNRKIINTTENHENPSRSPAGAGGKVERGGSAGAIDEWMTVPSASVTVPPRATRGLDTTSGDRGGIGGGAEVSLIGESLRSPSSTKASSPNWSGVASRIAV